MSTTRTRLLEAATRLFHEQGYHATGIATILREAEVSRASLYHFFPSKEDLLIGVLERYEEGLFANILAPSEAAAKDPVERVFHLLAQYRGFLASSGCALGCPIGNLALEVADDHPEVRVSIERNFAAWSAGIAAWLRKDAEAVRPDIDHDALADFVLCTLEGAILLSRAAGSLAPYDHCVEMLRIHFERLKPTASPLSKDPLP